MGTLLEPKIYDKGSGRASVLGLTTRQRFRLLGVAVAMGLATIGVGVSTLPGYGFAIDEATYVWVLRETRLWFAELPDQGLAAFAPSGIAKRWHYLEPPFRREAGHSNFNLPGSHHLMNLSWLLFHMFLDELTCYRLANLGLLGVTVASATFVIGVRWGLGAGLTAGGLLWASPRVFAHAHLATTETAVSSAWTLTLLAGLAWCHADALGVSARWPRLFFGLGVAFAFSVKLTGWLLAPPTLLWLLWARPSHWRKTLIASALFTPILVVAITPNLWFHPVSGLIDYVRLAGANPWKIATFYHGQGYLGCPPWPSGLILPAITMPIATFVLGAIGAGLAIRHQDARLVVLNAGLLIGMRLAGKTPGHDVERMILPLYYFLPILAGFAVGACARYLAAPWRSPHFTNVIGLACFALAGFEPAGETWRFRNHGLCYYNAFVGGLAGATRAGMEPTYWFEAVTSNDWRRMLGNLPVGAKVFFRPDHPGIDYLKEINVFPNHVIVADRPEDADYFFLYARRSAYLVTGADGILRDTDLGQKVLRGLADAEIRFQGVRLAGLFRTERFPTRIDPSR